MERRLLVAIVVVSLSRIVGAIVTASAADSGITYGVGANSCAEFTNEYATNPAAIENIYFSWAQGFISGLIACDVAAKVAQRRIEAGEASMNLYKLRIRTYCNSHPASLYAEGVLKLYNSLPLTR
jgi:hypothetical protein